MGMSEAIILDSGWIFDREADSCHLGEGIVGDDGKIRPLADYLPARLILEELEPAFSMKLTRQTNIYRRVQSRAEHVAE